MEDYELQDAIDFIAHDEWEMENGNRDFDSDEYADWYSDHYEEFEDQVNDQREEFDDYVNELLDDDPDWYESN